MKKILIFIVAMLVFASMTVTGCKKGEEVKPAHKTEHKKGKKSEPAKKKSSSKKSTEAQSTKKKSSQKKGVPPESMM
jgi:uncharacterized protein YxeA